MAVRDAAVAALVPAAGAGRRMGKPGSKLFLPLRGVPLLAHTLRALEASPSIRWIIVAARPAERAAVGRLLKRFRITKALPPCAGGASRAETVARAFRAAPAEARWVLVHDGARPCVRPRLIEEAVRAAKREGAVACGLPAPLTVKAVDERRRVRLTLDRAHLWFIQTPQVFRRDWFAEALARVDGRLAECPDDVAVLEAAGFRVSVIPGEPFNVKVTTREDLLLAETILQRSMRARTTR